MSFREWSAAKRAKRNKIFYLTISFRFSSQSSCSGEHVFSIMHCIFYCNVQPARLYAGGTRLIFFRMHLVFFHQLFYNPVYELPALVTAVHSGKPHYHTNIIQCRSYRFSQFISNSYGVWSFFKIVHTGQNVFIPGLRGRHFNKVHTNMVPRGYYRDRM